MPYKRNAQLPESVRHALKNVPHAQDIYREAFSSAWEQYADPKDRRDHMSRESTAHAVAWQAVKQKYRKGDDDKWHPK